jgi:PHD/YefM family antitoxin component YafN of YafNO toxin-antitoxin module
MLGWMFALVRLPPDELRALSEQLELLSLPTPRSAEEAAEGFGFRMVE